MRKKALTKLAKKPKAKPKVKSRWMITFVLPERAEPYRPLHFEKMDQVIRSLTLHNGLN